MEPGLGADGVSSVVDDLDGDVEMLKLPNLPMVAAKLEPSDMVVELAGAAGTAGSAADAGLLRPNVSVTFHSSPIAVKLMFMTAF